MQVHEELKASTGQRTVPYVYVIGRLLGGCDATKASIAAGEFDKLLGGGGAGEYAAQRVSPLTLTLPAPSFL